MLQLPAAAFPALLALLLLALAGAAWNSRFRRP